jgi:hypothetical protein
MTNLPDDLQSLLALARDAHDPVDPTARARVRHAITASLALGATAGGSLAPGILPATMQQGLTEGALSQSALSHTVASNTQAVVSTTWSGKLGASLFGSKLGALALTTVAAAGLGLAVYATRPSAAPAPRAPLASAGATVAGAASVPPGVSSHVEPPAAPPASDAPLPSEAPTDEPAQRAKARPARAPTRTLAKPAAAPRVDTLTAEIALLRGASEALARGDAPAALAVVQQHAQLYPQGRLREERDGLRAIAECSQPTRPSASSAQRFVRQYPESLMRARIAKVCDGKPP